MKKRLVCLFGMMIIFTNVVFADIKEDINKLDIIANSLDSLFISVIKEIETDTLSKKISFIEGQIISEKNKVLEIINKLDKDEKTRYLAILSVLNYYEISTIQIRKYYEENDSIALVDSISSFSEGSTILSTIKTRLPKLK